MKKASLFLISLVTLVALSLSSCGGGNSSNNNSSNNSKSDFDKLEIIDKGFESDNNFRDKMFLIKNISNDEVKNYNLKCKLYMKDGTSEIKNYYITLKPGEACTCGFNVKVFTRPEGEEVTSWKFLK